MAFADLGTLDDLLTLVERQEASVIHFSGHGLPGKLAFENDLGFAEIVDIATLLRQLRTRLLRPQQWQSFPRLFYLASCHGASGTASQVTEGAAAGPPAWPGRELRSEVEVVLGHGPSTAATLHRHGFTQVVGYHGPIGDALCTRAEEAFYQSLARGETTVQAVARARAGLDQPLTLDGQRIVYPLGWVQLTLYHRGPNLPLALPGSASSTRLPQRFQRQTVEVNGLPVLDLGFIGRRALQHEVRRRLRAGQRLLVLQGLGGLGKTALASQLLSKVLAPGQPRRQLILPCGVLQGVTDDPSARLTGYVIEHGRTHALPNWEQQVQQIEEQPYTPAERFTAVLQRAWQAVPDLVLYADNVEALQEGPTTPEATAIGQWRPAAQACWEGLAGLAEQGLTVLASTRYAWPGLSPNAWLPISRMSQTDVLRLLEAFETLNALPHQVKVQLAQRVDGHPRTLEFLDALISQRQQDLGLGYEITDPWRELVQPVLPATEEQVSTDLLLDVLWQRLSDSARAHAKQLGVLQQPAPRQVIAHLGFATDELIRTSLLTRHREQVREGEILQWTDRWGLHSLVQAYIVPQTSDAERHAAHAAAGEAYATWVQGPAARWADQVAGMQHFHAIGAGDRAWPLVQEYVLWLRGQGRYREALVLLEACEAAGTTGASLANALLLLVQMRGRLGERSASQVAILEWALTLTTADEALQGSLFHELGSTLQAQGDLPAARQHLERALDIQTRLYGSREHYNTAISEVNLGLLLREQGEATQAIALFRHAYEVLLRQLGPDHPKTRFVARLLQPGGARPVADPLQAALAQARAAAQGGDLAGAIAAQTRAVTLARDRATDDRERLMQLSVLLYNLANYSRQAERYEEAVVALEEVVALDEQTGHADLASDREALEAVRRLAAQTPAERAMAQAAAVAAAQPQALAEQVRDLVMATLQGQYERQACEAAVAQLHGFLTQAAAAEDADAPLAQVRTYLGAVLALLRGTPVPAVAPAFAAHLAAMVAARPEGA